MQISWNRLNDRFIISDNLNLRRFVFGRPVSLNLNYVTWSVGLDKFHKLHKDRLYAIAIYKNATYFLLHRPTPPTLSLCLLWRHKRISVILFITVFAKINGNIYFCVALISFSFFLPPVSWSYRATDLHQIWHDCVFPCRVSEALQKFGKSQKNRSRRAKNIEISSEVPSQLRSVCRNGWI